MGPIDKTAGERLYAIRLAYGDGVRSPEPLNKFAARVKREAGKKYDPATISLLERGKQKWKLSDAAVFAVLDPDKRGPWWLAFGILVIHEQPAIRGPHFADSIPLVAEEPLPKPAGRRRRQGGES